MLHWLNITAQLPRTLQIGDVLQATQLSLVEGSLRSASRKKGRYLSSLYRKGAGQMQRFVSGSLGHSLCSFFVRHTERPGGNFECTQISSSHTCARAIAEKPGDQLLARMAFFVSLAVAERLQLVADSFVPALNHFE